MNRSKILGSIALASMMLVVLTGCPSVISNVVSSSESVQQAVDQASSGDTIEVMGTHDEDVTIDQDDITLTSEDGATIDGDTEVNGDNVTIENITITGSLTTTPGSFKNLTLNNVTVQAWNATLTDTLTCTRIISGSIQTAVNNSSSGDSVCVEPGTYAENIDVEKDLSLVSIVDGGATLTGPGTTGGFLDTSYLVVRGNVSVNLDGFTFDGTFPDSSTAGILAVEGATVDAEGLTMNQMFQDDGNGKPSGNQSHHAIVVGDDILSAGGISGLSSQEGTLELTDSTINEFGKAAVVVTGTNSGATIDNVAINGSGTLVDNGYDPPAQDTIRVEKGSLSLKNSTIEDVVYEGSFTAGNAVTLWNDVGDVEVVDNSFNNVGNAVSFQPFRSSNPPCAISGVTVENNTVTNSFRGFELGVEGPPNVPSGPCSFGLENSTIVGNDLRNNETGIGIADALNNVDISNNNFDGNNVAVRNFASSVVDVTNNWFGDASGPNDPQNGESNDLSGNPNNCTNAADDYNSSGTGDKVEEPSSAVDYCPWATSSF